jgi:hypothetical protein
VNGVATDGVATDGVATDGAATDGVATDGTATNIDREMDFDVVEENVLVACSGFRLIPKVTEYLLLDATTLHDTKLKKVEFSDPTSIYSPLYTQYRQDDRKTCLECRRLQCRLCTRTVRFEKCRQD